MYNPAFYISLDSSGNLTYDYARTIFVDKNDYRMSYITGITPGAAIVGVSLVPGTGGNISGLGEVGCGSISCSGSISGTLSTGSQTNITSVGTLGSLTVSNAISCGSISCSGSISGTLSTGSQTNITSVGTLGSLTVSNAISCGSISCSGSISGTLSTGSQTNITSVGTLGSLTVSNAISCGSLSVGGSSIQSAPSYVLSITAGTAANGKAVVLDASGNIWTISSLTATSLISNTRTMCSTTSGETVASNAAANVGNLIINNMSDTVGSTATITFANDATSNLSQYTPGARIVAKRITGGFSPTDLQFWTKDSSAQNNSLFARMSITNAGNIRIGNVDEGDQLLNILSNVAPSFSISMRFGKSLTTNNCFTQSFYVAGDGVASNYLSWDSDGTSNCLVLTADNKVGIGTSAPLASLHVERSVASVVVGSTTTATATPSSFTGGRTGTFSDTTSIYCKEALKVGVRGIYISSDRRIKHKIQTIPNVVGTGFVKSINPVRYEIKCEDGKEQLGYIAQDLYQAGHALLLTLTKDDTMEAVPDDPWSIPGYRMSVSYERVIPLLHAALRDTFKQIETLNVKLDHIRRGWGDNS